MALLRLREGPARADQARAIYRDQIAEVDRDLSRGLIDAAEAERARTEVARRLLDADRILPSGAASPPAGLSRMAAILCGLVLLAGSLWLYLLIGSPGYGDQPRAARLVQGEAMRATRPSQAEAEARVADILAADRITPPAEIAETVAQLRAGLAETPDDLGGWMILTDFESRTGNLAAAAAAMAEVVRIKGDAATAGDLIGLADRLVYAAGGFVSPEAEAVLDRLAGIAPEHPALLYYTGLLYAQTDRADIAFGLWRRVIEEGGDGLHARLARDGIGDVAWLAGRDYAPPDAATEALPGPAAEDMAAAADMTPEDREAMIRGMVDGLSARLQGEGGTAAEWARLIASLGVLGEEARVRETLARAEAALAGDPAGLAEVRAAAGQAGLGP